MIRLRTCSVLALSTLGAIAACSPATSSDPTNTPTGSGGSSNPGTSSGGSAVIGASSGGAVIGASSGGASTTTGSGGAPTTTGSGGAPTTTGSGGAATETVSCEGTTLTIAKGYLDNGTVCGYGWTATNGAGETIDPPCGSAGPCFDGDMLCTSGTLPAVDAEAGDYTGVMIGVNAQTPKSGKPESTWAAAGSIAVSFDPGGLTGEVRIMLQSGGDDYCVANAVSGKAYPVTSFTQECWDGGDQAPALAAGDPVSSVVVQVNGTDADETFTDFCVTGITNN